MNSSKQLFNEQKEKRTEILKKISESLKNKTKEGKRSKKNNEEAPVTTRLQLIERLLTKFVVGGENEEGIHTVMADAHMKQKRVNRSTVEAPVNGTLD